ncbi:hypothetical protein F5887DRAFT_885268 [Amanita rubescens]|nr:hypothetical protein F5887DRAFT_885268 [Amanita rubescens]
MEVDDSTADEISPRCYVLDIGIRGVEDKIWVRADYIRMFEFAEKFYAESLSNPQSPCLVITGQPGIGKTLWRWYALRVCCAQKKPVILYSNGICWLFVEEGVFEQPTNFQPSYYKIVIWTLVDAADAPSGPPMGLITHGTQHFILYTTPPTPSRWDKIHQSMLRTVCVMNPWTKAEIHRAAPFRAPSVPLSAIEAIFYELGPTPRLCFGTERSLIEYRADLDGALEGLSLAYLESLTSRNRLALDAVSHKLFILRRSTIDVDSVLVYIQPISPFIASKVVRRMRALKRYELLSLFKRYNALPSTRRMSGDVFEAYCHVILSTRRELNLVPMVRIGGQPTVREKRMPQWFSSHTEFSGSVPQSQALEVLRANALASGASLDMYPSRVVDYDSTEIAGGLHIEADVYYVPIKTNQAGIDSFFLHDETLYLLQMTVSDTHGISDELWPFLVSLKGLPPKCNWRLIFVKPPGKILACFVPRSAELWDLNLYSVEVEVTSFLVKYMYSLLKIIKLSTWLYITSIYQGCGKA